jgi:GTP-binding protein
VPDSYHRYLVNRFRKAFRLKGTPVRLTFKSGDNPYKGRRNKLTPRQERRRKRMIKHVKK